MRRKQILCQFLFACLSLALVAATPLNPTVRVVPNPAVSPTPGCEQGLAPQPPVRVDATQIPAPPPTPVKHHRAAARATLVAPPSRSLKELLRITQTATGQNHLEAFRDSLTAVKSTLADYPHSREREAATSVVQVWDDVARVWQFSLDSPTGAFFDSESEIYPLVKRYPGFDAALRRQTLLDSDGHKIYPTAETRSFLIREAAKRLSNLGVAGMRPATSETHVASPKPPRHPAVSEPNAPTSTIATTTPSAQAHVDHARPMHHPATKHPHEPAVASANAQASSAPAHHGKKPASHSTTKAQAVAPATAAATAAAPPMPTTGSTATASTTKVSTSEPATKTTTKSSSHVESKPQPTQNVAATKPGASTPPVATTTASNTHSPASMETVATTSTTSTTPATSAVPTGATTSTGTGLSSSTATVTPTPIDATIATGTTPASATANPLTTTDATAPPSSTTTVSSSTTATETTTTATPAPAQPANGRGMLLPIILIVIGLGVLIVLFRASN